MEHSRAPDRPVAELPPALACFDALQARLAGRRPAIFLDFDGTLTPIVAHPDAAVLAPSARAAVAALATEIPVAIISGRDRLDVEARVGVDDLAFAGSHGFDIRFGERTATPAGVGFSEALDVAEALLHGRLDGVAGALVERKRFSIAAHYRNVGAPEAARVAEAVAEAATVAGLRTKTGKKVFELQPAVDWDKGRAVLWLLQQLRLDRPEIVPLFIGDDVTDEDAFRALAGRGVGIVVAQSGAVGRRSFADFRLTNVDEVIALLHRLRSHVGGSAFGAA